METWEVWIRRQLYDFVRFPIDTDYDYVIMNLAKRYNMSRDCLLVFRSFRWGDKDKRPFKKMPLPSKKKPCYIII